MAATYAYLQHLGAYSDGIMLNSNFLSTVKKNNIIVIKTNNFFSYEEQLYQWISRAYIDQFLIVQINSK